MCFCFLFRVPNLSVEFKCLLFGEFSWMLITSLRTICLVSGFIFFLGWSGILNFSFFSIAWCLLCHNLIDIKHVPSTKKSEFWISILGQELYAYLVDWSFSWEEVKYLIFHSSLILRSNSIDIKLVTSTKKSEFWISILTYCLTENKKLCTS